MILITYATCDDYSCMSSMEAIDTEVAPALEDWANVAAALGTTQTRARQIANEIMRRYVVQAAEVASQMGA